MYNLNLDVLDKYDINKLYFEVLTDEEKRKTL